jgi:hypothetical protein
MSYQYFIAHKLGFECGWMLFGVQDRIPAALEIAEQTHKLWGNASIFKGRTFDEARRIENVIWADGEWI